MTTHDSLRVQLAERSYSIHITDNTSNFAALLRQAFPQSKHVVVVFDQNVAEYAQTHGRSLTKLGMRITNIPVASGEESKSIQVLADLWQQMLQDHTDRGSLLVAVGGGVVGDLAGFAAATFARGIPLVQVPTTLLSQVDSSVGGKTGINLPGAKNIVGSFWQPGLVFIDTTTLDSLPSREFISGLAEVVKYGVILLPEVFGFLEQHWQSVLQRDPAALNWIITQSCRAKAMVVQEDEREITGRRAILNYGHTFAHAIETTAGYGTWLHGEAVSMGMHTAALLGEILGRVDSRYVARQQSLLEKLELPVIWPQTDPKTIWQAMQHDKKVHHGTLRFILPTQQLGKVDLVAGVTQQQACKAIELAMKRQRPIC